MVKQQIIRYFYIRLNKNHKVQIEVTLITNLKFSVLIVLMGQGIGTSLSVLQMLQSRGISTSEFVIILPWLQRTPDERLPWLSQDLTVDVNVFTAFSGSVIVSKFMI